MTSGDDDVLRLLHTSDWHLGCPYKRFRPFERQRLQRARFDALEHVFRTAQQYQVHAVLGAGDLFDEPTPTESVWRGLLRVLEDHAGSCPVILVPGNHDPLVDGSIWQANHHFRRELPDFVHVVDRDDFTLGLPHGATVYARPTRTRKSSEDPVLGLPPRPPGDDTIRIGVVHGQTFRFDDQTAAHPVDPESARKQGLDYLALGDTHGFREIRAGSPAVFYSGTHEQHDFGETDAGQVALVSIRRRTRSCRVEKLPVGTLAWVREEVSSVEQIHEIMSRGLESMVLWLTVTGRFDPESHTRLEDLLAELEGDEELPGRAAAIQIERAHRLDDASLEALFEEAPDELREAARLLKARRAEGQLDPEVIDRAMARLYRIAREVT